jgi:hypothetical protein
MSSSSGPTPPPRNLIAKRKQKEMEEDEKAKAAQAEIDKRIRLRNLVLKEFAPFLSGEGTGGEGGALGKASHLATMQAEAVAAILITDLIIFFFQLVFNTPFLIHKAQFDAVFKKQLNEMYKGNNIQLVYLPDEKGVWPDIYVVDEFDDIDFTQTYPPGQAPLHAVRLQGFVPKPTLKEGYLNALNLHMERMWGGRALSDAEKLKLRNMVEVGEPEARRQDKLRDLMMARPPIRPKPGTT